MIYRLLAVLVIVIALGGTVFLSQQRDTADAPVATDVVHNEPGYSAKNATLIETGDDGLPLYTLHAITIGQTPRSDIAHLSGIQMDFRDSSGAIWNLRANRSDVRQASESLDLYGDVRVTGRPSGSQSMAQIVTEMLSFDTRSEVATTQAPVTLDWAGQKLSAVGMFADLKDRHIRLESGVHGLFSR